MQVGTVHFFKTPAQLRAWFQTNHLSEKELWIGFYKKASGKTSLTYEQVLDEALCFGWIDGIAKKHTDESFTTRYTPRGKKSVWSKINVGHIERLTKEERMQPQGLKVVADAKADGRWAAAYSSPASMVVPDDFLNLLKSDKKAHEFYEGLNKVNKYAIGYRLQTARKAETRARLLQKFFEMMKNGQKFH